MKETAQIRWTVPAALALLLGCAAVSLYAPSVQAARPSAQAQCLAMAGIMSHHWPDPSTRLLSAQWQEAGPVALSGQPGMGPTSIEAPAHCELTGVMQERLGEGGQHYAIHFHLRLPEDWNGRFFFQGGGGSDGVIGDALGIYSAAAKPALAQGFAVLSQDAGHDNSVNNDPARGGVLVFGFDEQARANYGHASLPIAARAAKAAVRQFYGTAPKHSYFVGCSKGGNEGMALAQRYPEEFDGIVANAPAISLPRAGLAEAWDTQAVASVALAPGEKGLEFSKFAHAYSDADLALVREAVLAACDADDGLKDGVVDDFIHCTSARVRPQLDARRCAQEKRDGCLSTLQIEALVRIMDGAHDSAGHALYSDWPWDAGIGGQGWRIWKMGAYNGMPPALNILLGGASLSSDFTTPPTAVRGDPQSQLDFLLSFDFDRDAPKLYATNAQFPRSAWEDISARSTDLSGFRRRHGRMIVVQGVSDPVFSINDTLEWWREVNQKNAEQAGQFVRVYPVPGMNHCGGGDATDRFDVLAPLMAWVERGEVPESIHATTSPAAPGAQRSRPLCSYPKIAHYDGSGDPALESSFRCEVPVAPQAAQGADKP